jgi:D-alanine--poly(phosphoribitol) ligase subunit 1
MRTSGGEELSYRALWDASEALAKWLGASGAASALGPVAVIGHKQPLMLACFIACAKSGRAYVPLDDSLPLERVNGILAQLASQSARPLVLLAGGEYRPESLAGEVVSRAQLDACVTAAAQAGSRVPLKLVPREGWVSGEDLFYLLFTSGSTGTPKGVEITARCHDSFLPWALGLIGAQVGMHGAYEAPADAATYLNQAPFSFDLSVFELTMALASGGSIFALTRETQASFAALTAAVSDAEIDVWVSTPSFAELCLKDRAFDASVLPRVSSFLFCGEVLLPQTARQLLERFAGSRVINTYGPTESTVAVTSVVIDAALAAGTAALPVGRPRPGTIIRICDEDGGELAPGEVGEITIAGDTVARGYFGNPALTAERFGRQAVGMDELCRLDASAACGSDPGMLASLRSYRTGDSGLLDESGMLHFRGRLDNQVKLSGYRIELGDIEEHLCALGGVLNAVVLPVTIEGKVSHLVACVVEEPAARQWATAAGQTQESDFKRGIALKKRLGEALPSYMVPKTVRFFEGFPLTANGKVDRGRLAALLAQSRAPHDG